MKKVKRDITILTIGDGIDFDSFKKFNRERTVFNKNGFDYAAVSYQRFLKGKIPPIKTSKVIIFLFFPFAFWNEHIEHKDYKGIYGNRHFSEKFNHFWQLTNSIIKEKLSTKKILFINTPQLCAQCRDKKILNRKLARDHLLQPQKYTIDSLKMMYHYLDKGHTFFIKPRCGSMGKGITFVSNYLWKTNFTFKNDKIISRRSDKGWSFREITGNKKFLNQILKKDFIIEEGVDSLIVNHCKLDLRIYTFFKKAVYVYPRVNEPENITTNISQGGHGEPRLVDILPKKLVRKAKSAAESASRILDLNFAGIDIMLHRNRREVFVIDVNAFPGFPKRKTFNLSKDLINNLVELSDKGKLHFNKLKGGKK